MVHYSAVLMTDYVILTNTVLSQLALTKVNSVLTGLVQLGGAQRNTGQGDGSGQNKQVGHQGLLSSKTLQCSIQIYKENHYIM